MARTSFYHNKHKTLDEDYLRLYSMCKRRYSFGGQLPPNLYAEILEATYTKLAQVLLLESISETEVVEYDRIDRILLSCAFQNEAFRELLSPQQAATLRKLRVNLAEVLRLLPLKNYVVIAGPQTHKVHISRTTIELRTPILLKSKTSAIHSVQFSPFTDMHSALNDPVTAIKLLTLKRFHQGLKRSNVAQSTLHVFFPMDAGEEIGYTSLTDRDISKGHARGIHSLIRDFESQADYPLTPCRLACEFKQNCFPRNTNDWNK